MVIETERLQLRPLTMADLEELVALHAKPEVSRFVRQLSREEATERIQACQREWRDRGHGLLAIASRDTGEFLGRAGVKYWPQFDETEIGWVLNPGVWGHGYASEAARACVDWAFLNLDVAYLTAMIRPDNARSIHVAERVDMTPLRNDVLLNIPVVVYSISRNDWDPEPRRIELVVVREVRPGDGEALARLHADLARYYLQLASDDFQLPNPDGFADELDTEIGDPAATPLRLVAESNGRVVGAIVALLMPAEAGADRQINPDLAQIRLRIEYLATAASHRRRGIGTRLVDAAEAWGRTGGATIAETTTYQDSPLSVPFWKERVGYQARSINLRKRL